RAKEIYVIRRVLLSLGRRPAIEDFAGAMPCALANGRGSPDSWGRASAKAGELASGFRGIGRIGHSSRTGAALACRAAGAAARGEGSDASRRSGPLPSAAYNQAT